MIIPANNFTQKYNFECFQIFLKFQISDLLYNFPHDHLGLKYQPKNLFYLNILKIIQIQTRQYPKFLQFFYGQLVLVSIFSQYHLDWLSKEQLAGKPVALVSLLGGKSNTSTLNHMRHVCRWLGALCIPEQIAIPHGKTHLEGGVISDSDLSERLDSVLESLLDITHKLH